MRRRLTTILALGSLTLLLGLAFLWVRSYRWSDQIGFTWQARSHARTAELYATSGSIGVAFIHCIDHRPNYNGEPDVFANTWQFYAGGQAGRPYFPNGRGSFGGHGFWLDLGDDTPGWRFQNNIRIAEVPIWSLVLIALVLPAMASLRWYFRRVPPGACAKCGYDLRATPGRCPECGTAPSGRPAAA